MVVSTAAAKVVSLAVAMKAEKAAAGVARGLVDRAAVKARAAAAAQLAEALSRTPGKA